MPDTHTHTASVYLTCHYKSLAYFVTVLMGLLLILQVTFITFMSGFVLHRLT